MFSMKSYLFKLFKVVVFFPKKSCSGPIHQPFSYKKIKDIFDDNYKRVWDASDDNLQRVKDTSDDNLQIGRGYI